MKKALSTILITTVLAGACVPKEEVSQEAITDTVSTESSTSYDATSQGYQSTGTTASDAPLPEATVMSTGLDYPARPSGTLDIEVMLTAPAVMTPHTKGVAGGFTFAWKAKDKTGCAAQHPYNIQDYEMVEKNRELEKWKAELDSAFYSKTPVRIQTDGYSNVDCAELVKYEILQRKPIE